MPTAAFIGGRLSEDVINVLGKREQPIQNFALFDGDGLDGRIYSLYSPPPEVALAGQLDGVVGANSTIVDGMGEGVGNGTGTMAAMQPDLGIVDGGVQAAV